MGTERTGTMEKRFGATAVVEKPAKLLA